MIETRDLYKVYKPKKGVPVTAVNRVSIKFPDRGMVFLLGKSGSGKSTLLNLLGGLDSYDGGEIIVNGVSSKDFKQKHFDSYRNTYVGFIFQEYNVLDEFSVGANVALAIELQGRKATEEEINGILSEVDLEGFGNRKPNELSGGQKQRVAIARALVKNPEIIMADEPTGALDSNTAKQVFDTLKKLSKDRLVIIVSHDREFSELYADRIIELSDGNIISDVEIAGDSEEDENVNISFKGDVIEITPGYQFTESDRLAVNAYIERITDQTYNIRLNEDGSAVNKFVPTNEKKIKADENRKFKLIKSKLPLKNAIKMGVSALKYKKIRLGITIALASIAFALFGLAATCASYDFVDAGINSLKDSEDQAIILNQFENGEDFEYDSFVIDGIKFEEKDILDINNELGINAQGIYKVHQYIDNLNVNGQELPLTQYGEYYYQNWNGFVEINESILKDYGYELVAGRYPEGDKNEVAISTYEYMMFEKAGYIENPFRQETSEVQEIKSYKDIIGKTIKIRNLEYMITGIVDTKLDLSEFEELKNTRLGDDFKYYTMGQRLDNAIYCSMAAVLMVGEGHIENLINESSLINENVGSIRLINSNGPSNDTLGISYRIATDASINKADIMWLGEKKSKLADNEIIIASDLICGICNSQEEIDDILNEKYSGLAEMKLEGRVYCGYGELEGIVTKEFVIVGVIPVTWENEYWNSSVMISQTDFDENFVVKEGVYSSLIVPNSLSEDSMKKMLKRCLEDNSNGEGIAVVNISIKYLTEINAIGKILTKVFFFIGIGFAIFASIMLANFIGTSINYKKREIGILRALGARSSDVFAVFFSEAMVITIFDFLLATLLAYFATFGINTIIRNEIGLPVTLLEFGLPSVLLILLISLVVTIIACAAPIIKISRRKPIDAIQDRK